MKRRIIATNLKWSFYERQKERGRILGLGKEIPGIDIPAIAGADDHDKCRLLEVEIRMLVHGELQAALDSNRFGPKMMDFVDELTVAEGIFDGYKWTRDFRKLTLTFPFAKNEAKNDTAMKKFLGFTDKLGIPRTQIPPPVVSQETYVIRRGSWLTIGKLLHMKHCDGLSQQH